jgi:hypothetical protein
VTRIVYLSWGADLLRAATTPGADLDNAAWYLVMLCLLGATAFVCGRLFIGRFLQRARALGALAKE